MKLSEFKKQIEEAIIEILGEENAMVKTKKGGTSIVDMPVDKLKTLAKDTNVVSIETTSGQKVKG